MTKQRYAIQESWNRLLRLFKGDAPATDVPGEVTDEIVSVDEAISEIAELLACSLPGEYVRLPWSHYGEIYGVSGTSFGLSNQTWTDVPIPSNGLSSCHHVTPDADNDRIILTDRGVYFVDFNISYQMDVIRNVTFRVKNGTDVADQIRVSELTLGSNFHSVSAGGFIALNSDENLGVEMYSGDGTGTVSILSSQLNVRKVY